jgi:hypothetical protein
VVAHDHGQGWIDEAASRSDPCSFKRVATHSTPEHVPRKLGGDSGVDLSSEYALVLEDRSVILGSIEANHDGLLREMMEQKSCGIF